MTPVRVDDAITHELTIAGLKHLAARQLGVDPNFFALHRHEAVVPPSVTLTEALQLDSRAAFSLKLGPPPGRSPLEMSGSIIGTERMMVAHLPVPGAPLHAPSVPIFLTEEQHRDLEHFISAPCIHPALVMLTGTIKSGKSTVLHRVLPGMASARYAKQPSLPVPVFFSYAFPNALSSADEGMVYALRELNALAKQLGCPTFDDPPESALSMFPRRVQELAESISMRNGQLWVLLNEVQSPVLASTPQETARFTEVLKKVVERCAGHAKVGVTGRGMFSLMDAVRNHYVNGFSLWTSSKRISVGSSYNVATATAIAKALKAVHAPALPVTPAQLVHDVGLDGRAPGLTSARPALMAYLLQASNAHLLQKPAAAYDLGWADVVGKLNFESTRDTARGLIYMVREARDFLLQLAERPVATLDPDSASAADLGLHDFVNALSEQSGGTGKTQSLQAPYPALLKAWILPGGDLAIDLQDNHVVLPIRSLRILQYLADQRREINALVKADISTAVLTTLASNGVGVRSLDKDGKPCIRPPQSLEEIASIDAFQGLVRTLHKQGPSHSENALLQAVNAGNAQYLAEFGFTLLIGIRHWGSHYSVPSSSRLFTTAGLTHRVIESALRAAVECLGKHKYTVDKDGAVLEPSPTIVVTVGEPAT